MKRAVRPMDQAIRDVANQLVQRDITKARAEEMYREYDQRYRSTVNHKTRRGSSEMYVRREGCALYLKERYGVEVQG